MAYSRIVPELADESGRLVLELHGVLQEMDRARWKAEATDALRARLRAIQERMKALTDSSSPASSQPDVDRAEASDLRAKLLSMSDALATQLPEEETSLGRARVRWMAFRGELVPRYEALERLLVQLQVHVPSLRPTNFRRSFFHVLMAAATLAILYALPDPSWGIAITGALVAWAWTTEIARRRSKWVNDLVMKAFAPIAHPHEWRRINSATWYSTALFILSLTQAPLICAIGVAVLGFGDPAAAYVGRRWGRRRLVHGRTLEGTVAFFASASLVAIVAARLFAPELAWPLTLAMAVAGALAGAFAELFSLRIDDNLSVALSAAAAAAVVSWL